MDEETLQQIYTWIDEIPLSRPKRNIIRDFSDGVLIAEIIHHFIPKMVDLHNYTAANSTTQKMDNWNLLSRKCFSKLPYSIAENDVKGVVGCKPGVIEVVLHELRHHIESYLARKKAASMLEKHEIQDELTSDVYNSDYLQNGYDSFIGYGYPAYTDPYGNQIVQHQQQQVQQQQHMQQQKQFINNNVSTQQQQLYQYQTTPHVTQDIEANPPVKQSHTPPPKNTADGTSKYRKPVTQATKMKSKVPTSKESPAKSEDGNLRILLEEKEQALLASQETVQILNVKIRRLEHLLHLKDLRINELKDQTQNQQQSNSPQRPHLPPNQNYPSHMPPQAYPNTQFPLHPPLPQIPQIPQRAPIDDSRNRR